MEFTMKKPPIKSNESRSYKRQLNLHISLLFISLIAILTKAFIALPEGEVFAPDALFKTFLMLAVGALVSVIVELFYSLSEGTAQDFSKYKRLIDPINTGLIIALLLPSSTPIYVLVLAVVVGVYAGKIVYGGYGYYIFNPALVGVLFANISFASQITYGDTPLVLLKGLFESGTSNSFNYVDLVIGNYHAIAIGSTSAIVLLALFAYLAINKVIDIRISGTFAVSIIIISAVIGFVNFGTAGMITYTLVNFLTGLTMFAAVFLISESVSSPTSRETKIIYAVVVAILTMAVRTLGSNIEGVVFAILFGNMITPFLNRTVKRSNTNSLIKTLVISGLIVVLTGFAFGFIVQGRLVDLFNVAAIGGLF